VEIAQLAVNWEDAYRTYEDASAANIADTSRAVAMAWRALGADTTLPWWLTAAVLSAAEAFEHQADTWSERQCPHDEQLGTGARSRMDGDCQCSRLFLLLDPPVADIA
jgi:hypothetical protein